MNDIEEFLRRAAALRAQQAQKAQPGAPKAQPARPAQQRPAAPTPPRTSPLRPVMTPSAEVMEAEVIEDDAVSGDDVARLVEQHLDNRGFVERASHLAESVRGSDDVIEAHLHETFEHRLGQLGESTSRAEDSTLDDEDSAAKVTVTAASLSGEAVAKLLRSPRELRTAILLREILDRPQHLW